MKRAPLLFALLLCSCDKTPPADLLRMADAVARYTVPEAGPPWSASMCKPLPEPEVAASFSDLTFSGECAVHIALAVQCLSSSDDFYIAAERPLEGGRSLKLFVNVESFAGPGEYERGGEIRVLVQDGPTLYQWVHYQTGVSLGTTDRANATGSFKVEDAPAVTTAIIKPVSLYAAPGTPTTGFIKLEGTIACAPPGTGPTMPPPAP